MARKVMQVREEEEEKRSSSPHSESINKLHSQSISYGPASVIALCRSRLCAARDQVRGDAIEESKAGAAQGLALIVTFVIKRGRKITGGSVVKLHLQCQRWKRAGRREKGGTFLHVCLQQCLKVNTGGFLIFDAVWSHQGQSSPGICAHITQLSCKRFRCDWVTKCLSYHIF